MLPGIRLEIQMLKFRPVYFLLTALFFITEILIAVFVKDDFIRPYVGDMLVVILLYCFLRSFFRIAVFPGAILVLAFSFLVEFLQYFNFISRIGLEDSSLAKIVLGNSFSAGDLLMYTIGAVLILIMERLRLRRMNIRHI